MEFRVEGNLPEIKAIRDRIRNERLDDNVLLDKAMSTVSALSDLVREYRHRYAGLKEMLKTRERMIQVLAQRLELTTAELEKLKAEVAAKEESNKPQNSPEPVQSASPLAP